MLAKGENGDEFGQFGQVACSELLQRPATASSTVVIVYPSRRRCTSRSHHRDLLCNLRHTTSYASRLARSSATNDSFSLNALEFFAPTTNDHSFYSLIILLKNTCYSGHLTKTLLGLTPSNFARLFPHYFERSHLITLARNEPRPAPSFFQLRFQRYPHTLSQHRCTLSASERSTTTQQKIASRSYPESIR